MAWCPNGSELDQDIADALSEFFFQLVERAETLAEEFGVPAFAAKALHRIDGSVTMKELGRRMHCDPSFVTMIADMLERMPWCRALDVSEKSGFLSMTRKMNVVLVDGSDPQAPGERAGEVGDIPTAASPHAA